MSDDRRVDFVTGPEFKRWMDEESTTRDRIERRMEAGFSRLETAIVRVEDQVREANGKTSKHAEAIAVIQTDVQAIKTGHEKMDKLVVGIDRDGCGRYPEHRLLLDGFDGNDRAKAKSWVAGLSRPQKTAAVGGVFALLLPTAVDLVKIGYDALRWFESLHHNLTK